MDIYTSIIEFFGIDALTSASTMTEYLNCIIQIFVSVYLVCFIIRSLFLVVVIPERKL